MIIRGGENIFPKEIEEYLMQHPNITDVQVIGVNDELMGEELCAWIKFKDEHKASLDELHGHMKGKIAHYKIPRYVRFVQGFPLTVTGKVKKNEMRHITNELLKQANHDIKELRI